MTRSDRLSRPGRRALVVADLGTLRGPTTGVVTLPHRLVWAPPPAGRFDLADAYDRARLYEIVLREAVRAAELQTWLSGDLLVELWPRLYLPRGVRQAWEEVHQRLAAVPVV
ncbi:hypothetical protein Aph02nite_24930 [Actinoplanes philippinensis]|uniref:Uncharacterized protein n=1 Tax=Actinoplanes philippinensis TaxID=35752 RepID=A0A1I2G395_9ACTN|nr:hypothetical protein [Actinoplanes philippinensis]GIE76543.1 hypothetical protein Aph02nite_24930 [Actinoplanes philippinensis]SFF11593.1 hypothetical protein SAMN05421541_106152 [Actinoplanes philippinensis]